MRVVLLTEHSRNQKVGLIDVIERYASPEHAEWSQKAINQGKHGVREPAILSAMIIEITAALAEIIDLQARRIDELEAVVGKKRAA